MLLSQTSGGTCTEAHCLSGNLCTLEDPFECGSGWSVAAGLRYLATCRLYGILDDEAALRLLENNPDVVMTLSCNRHLSLW